MSQRNSTTCVCGSHYHTVQQCTVSAGWKPDQLAMYHQQQQCQPTWQQLGVPLSTLGIQRKIATPVVFQQTPGNVFIRRVFCGVRGCTSCILPGQKHKCKKCGDQNSTHLTRDCPVPLVICGIRGCTYCIRPGQTHLCKVKIGRAQDSTHLTRDCPVQRVYCRARGCTYCINPGQKHQCRNCGAQDSTHLARDCPNLYAL